MDRDETVRGIEENTRRIEAIIADLKAERLAPNPCPACAKPLRPRATYCDRFGWTRDADPLAGLTWPGGAA